MTHLAVVDLAYGDSGKGALVDRICADRPVQMVIRANGGCQAAHNVVTDAGIHHTFAQFGSGTLQGVPTFLSKHMMVEPFALENEAKHLADSCGITDPLSTVEISERALLTTPYHWRLNKWAEDRRGTQRHGSTGRGIGPTAEFAELLPTIAPRVGDLRHRSTLALKLRKLHEWVATLTRGESEFPPVDQLLDRYDAVVPALTIVADDRLGEHLDAGMCLFEGAQGVLLDGDYGFHPHTTWSDTTDRNPRALVAAYGHELDVVGVVRAYTTRHGAGPFVAEDLDLHFPEQHNGFGEYQGAWRTGHFDAQGIAYGIEVCERVDSLYVTHVDAALTVPGLKACFAYLTPTDWAVWPGPLALNPRDLAAREQQTRLMMTLKPVLWNKPEGLGWAEWIAGLLELPLYGMGFGPFTRSGTFFELDKVTSGG